MNAGNQGTVMKMLLILITVNAIFMFGQYLMTNEMMQNEDSDFYKILPGVTEMNELGEQSNSFREENQSESEWKNNTAVNNFFSWNLITNLWMFMKLFFTLLFGYLIAPLTSYGAGEAPVLLYIGSLISLIVIIMNITYIGRMFALIKGSGR